MDTSLSARIARGIACLDERIPGWRENVNLDRLDMSSHEDGVLEQLFGSFVAGHRALRIGFSSAAAFGFDLQEEGQGEEDWAELTAAWKEALQPERKKEED